MKQNNRSFLFYTWPRIAVHHPWRVLSGALVALVLLIALSSAAGGSFSDSFSIPNSEAQQAYDLLKARFPQRAGDSATVVVKADAGLASPAVHTKVDDLV